MQKLQKDTGSKRMRPKLYLAHRCRVWVPGTEQFDAAAMALQQDDAAEWQRFLTGCGYRCYNPIANYRALDYAVPADEILDMCIEDLSEMDPLTDGLVVSPGWREGDDPVTGMWLPESGGVRREIEEARTLDLTIIPAMHGPAWVRWFLLEGWHDPQADPEVAELLRQT